MTDKLPKRIREARNRLNISQKELAERTGISTSQISLFESGGRAPSIKNIKKLAEGLSVSADYLLGLNYRMKVVCDIDGDIDGRVKSIRDIAESLL